MFLHHLFDNFFPLSFSVLFVPFLFPGKPTQEKSRKRRRQKSFLLGFFSPFLVLADQKKFRSFGHLD
jgi:hypothetical protein